MPVFVIAKPLADGGARDVVLEAAWRSTDGAAIIRKRSRNSAARSSATPPTEWAFRCLIARPGEMARTARSNARCAQAGGADVRSVEVGRARQPIRCRRRAFAPSDETGANRAAFASPRPQPRPEVMAIDAYVPGKERRAGSREGSQAFVERNAARPFAEGDRGVPRRSPIISRSIPTAPRHACARRSRAAMVSTPRRSFAAMVRTMISPARARLPQPGDEGSLYPARFSRISDRHPRGRRRFAGRRRRRRSTARRRWIAAPR